MTPDQQPPQQQEDGIQNAIHKATDVANEGIARASEGYWQHVQPNIVRAEKGIARTSRRVWGATSKFFGEQYDNVRFGTFNLRQSVKATMPVISMGLLAANRPLEAAIVSVAQHIPHVAGSTMRSLHMLFEGQGAKSIIPFTAAVAEVGVPALAYFADGASANIAISVLNLNSALSTVEEEIAGKNAKLARQEQKVASQPTPLRRLA